MADLLALDRELTRIQESLERLGTISSNMLSDRKALELVSEQKLSTLQTGARYISEQIEVLKKMPGLERTKWQS